MKYAISKGANEKVSKDMEVIVEEIRRKIPEVLSIILTGSFSRGEGPVKKIDGKYYPYNDYDIQVIARNKISKKEVDNISNEISKKLGYGGIEYFYDFKKQDQKMRENFYVDLKVETPKELRNLLPRIRNYELKNHSMVLDGRDLRWLIPGFSLIDVPLSDGGKLILDRLSQLIQYYSIDGKYDEEFLTYIIQQAYSACCTALLMLSGKYETGYGKAMTIFKENYKKDFYELYKKIPDLDKKIEVYVNWKKNPEKLPFENVKEEWFIARDNVIEVAKYFFSKFLGKDIKDIDELSNSILNMDKDFYIPYIKLIVKQKVGIWVDDKLLVPLVPIVSMILKYKYHKRLRSMGIRMKRGKLGVLFRKSPDLTIFASLIYIANSINEKGVDMDELNRGKRLLSRVYPVKYSNWEDISLDYGNSYIAFFMQKL